MLPASSAVTGDQRASVGVRRSLGLVKLAWVFGAVWLYITTGAVLTRFAQLAQMPKFGFGLLAALPFAGALMQLPASYFIERYGHRKTLFISLGILHRSLWIAVAAIPWFLPAGFQWQGLIMVIALSWVAGQMVAPAWVSWMADLVPARLRGRYFSRRGQLGQLVGVVVTVAVGYVLDRATLAGEVVLLRTLSGALCVAGVTGIADFLFFTGVPDAPRQAPDPQMSLRTVLREPLRDANFRRFLGFTATLTFGIGYVGQFAWLYIFDVAGMNNTEANAMLIVMPLLVVMGSLPMWGRLLDRFGRKPVLLIAGLLIVPGSTAWIFVTREHWVAGYLVVIVATAAWSGIELGNFNVLLSMSDPQSGRRQGSSYMAINSTVAALTGILSGLFGGAVAQVLGDWRTTVFGWPITYHGVLFIISSGLRLAAVGWLFKLVDTGSRPTRAALRYLGTNLYSNMQQAMFTPARLLQQLGRWTYQLNASRPFRQRRRRK